MTEQGVIYPPQKEQKKYGFRPFIREIISYFDPYIRRSKAGKALSYFPTVAVTASLTREVLSNFIRVIPLMAVVRIASYGVVIPSSSTVLCPIYWKLAAYLSGKGVAG